MPQKWYYKTMIPIPGFMYKISFLKNWENLHHYLTFLKGLSLESYSLLKLPVACKNINDVFSARPIIYPLYSIHRTRSCAHVLEEPISFLDFLANKASFEVRKQQQC